MRDILGCVGLIIGGSVSFPDVTGPFNYTNTLLLAYSRKEITESRGRVTHHFWFGRALL